MGCNISSCFGKLTECMFSPKLQMDKGLANDCLIGEQKYKLVVGADEMEYYYTSNIDVMDIKYCDSSSITTATTPTTDEEEKAIRTNIWKSLPVPMKNPQGVFIGNTLFVGGGFTASSKTDAAVFAYKDSSDSWVTLPPLSRALKSSALTTVGNKLVLLGGKENQPKNGGVFKWEFTSTNRIAVWDLEKQSWESSLPPMIAPRVSAVVVRHGCYIIVAGGNAGALDYRAELLDTSASPMCWVCSPILPVPCHHKTSAVASGRWYLLDTLRGDIFYTEVDSYIKQTLLLQGDTPSNIASVSSSGWCKLAHKASSDTTPFKIASLGSHLIAFTDVQGKLASHMLQEDGTWSVISGRQLPPSLASALVLSRDTDNTTLVLGGENSAGFSDKTYKLSLTTRAELKESKSRQRVTLWSTAKTIDVCA